MELTIGKWKLWLCFPVALTKLMAEAAYGAGRLILVHSLNVQWYG